MSCTICRRLQQYLLCHSCQIFSSPRFIIQTGNYLLLVVHVPLSPVSALHLRANCMESYVAVIPDIDSTGRYTLQYHSLSSATFWFGNYARTVYIACYNLSYTLFPAFLFSKYSSSYHLSGQDPT